VGVTQVGTKGYSKAALDAIKFAPVVGMTWGGEDHKMLEMFSVFDKRKPFVDVSTPKVKGLRELKNLDCTLSPVKCQHRQGFSRSNDDFSFFFKFSPHLVYLEVLCAVRV
jgi:hypothetical protein